jgi:hypothetical protein
MKNRFFQPEKPFFFCASERKGKEMKISLLEPTG